MIQFDLWFMLCVMVSNLIVCQDDEKELIQKLREFALPSHRMEQDRLLGMAGSFEWTYKSELSDGNGSPVRKLERKYSGSRRDGSFIADDLETIILRNPRYEATVEKAEKPGMFVLRGGKWQRPNIRIRESYLEAEFDQLLLAACPKSLELDAFLNNPKRFKIARVEAIENDIELEVDSLQPPSPRMKSLKVIVRFRMTENWRCISQEYKTVFDRKSTTVTVIPSVENHPNYGMITRSLEVIESVDSNRGFEKKEVFQLISIEKQSAPQDDFFLRKYGISESALIPFDGPEPSPNKQLLYLSICIIVSLAAFFASHFLSRRRLQKK